MIHYNNIEILPKEVCDIKLGPGWFFKFLKNKKIRLGQFFEFLNFQIPEPDYYEKNKYPPHISYDYDYVNLITY